MKSYMLDSDIASMAMRLLITVLAIAADAVWLLQVCVDRHAGSEHVVPPTAQPQELQDPQGALLLGLMGASGREEGRKGGREGAREGVTKCSCIGLVDRVKRGARGTPTRQPSATGRGPLGRERGYGPAASL